MRIRKRTKATRKSQMIPMDKTRMKAMDNYDQKTENAIRKLRKIIREQEKINTNNTLKNTYRTKDDNQKIS